MDDLTILRDAHRVDAPLPDLVARERALLDDMMRGGRGGRGRTGNGRRKRLLVGVGAVVVLSAAALAGSFVVGTSSGKVDVASAAWAAVPSPASQDVVNRMADECGPLVSEWLASYRPKGAAVPDPGTIPSAVEERGTTTMAVYFDGQYGAVCFSFGDGSAMLQAFSGTAREFGPDGTSMQASTFSLDGRTIGFLWGDLPTKHRATTEVYFEQTGSGEAIKATNIEAVGRYVAWVPNVSATISTKFIDTAAKAALVAGEADDVVILGPINFPGPCLGDCSPSVDPETPASSTPTDSNGHSVGVSEIYPTTTFGCVDPDACQP